MNIRKIEPLNDPIAVEQIASVYQEAFGGEPWNEGYVCPVCRKTFPITTLKACPSCFDREVIFVLLVECWPKNKVVSDFYSEMAKPEALCLVATTENEGVVAFAWGYQITVDQNTDAELEAPGLHKLVHGAFFYLDEVAVSPEHQSRGVGKRLVDQIFAKQNNKRILLRTLGESQMFHLIKKMGGGVILDISRGRVIMELDRD